MRGSGVGAAGGQWRSGRSLQLLTTGFLGKNSQLPEAMGSGGGDPNARQFLQLFSKNKAF